MDRIPEYDEIVIDDGRLTLDRMIRTLYRNKDGFLCANEKNHAIAIDERHNAVCLYIYSVDKGLYTLDVHYIYAAWPPDDYAEWWKIAREAVDAMIVRPPPLFHGVYGWVTTTIRITPIRTGDALITVDKKGARGVRIAFNRRGKNRKTRAR